MDTERTLSLLLGLHASHLARSTPLSGEETDCSHWLESDFFRGGLQVLQSLRNPFEEEKGESRSSSVTTTPGTGEHGGINVEGLYGPCCYVLVSWLY
ncbi:hypothetical protein DPMN_116871 [Dreissena polymorpha]|uniref:Uncharacterized protein n=1 Tax=Dreissena polymorpha TaxID=45954 RepID=A0A9D4KQM0_DREPO|nr:hypothetical protein DPMN_116871 [Dreissena polymorpha]